MLELRDYQKQAIEEIEAAIAFGSTHIVLDAPVAYGKSIVIAELCNTFSNSNIVILLNIEALIDQIAEALQQRNVKYSILKAGREKEFNENERVQIVFSQTYYARYQKINLKCDYLLKDEEHIEYSTQRTKRVLSTLKPKARIGFSGTPFDQNGFALYDSETISTISMKDLIEQKYLSEVKFYAPYLAEKKDYSKVKKSGVDYSAAELNKITNTKNHMTIMTDSLKKLKLQDKKILVFANSIEQCEFAAKHLQENGYSAFPYHSKIDDDVLDAVMQSFRTNEKLVLPENTDKNLFNYNKKTEELRPVRCLVSISKLTTGFSVSDIDVGVMLNKSLVKSRVFQISGRIYRKHENKPYGVILDLGQNFSTHGFPHEPYSPPQRTLDQTKDSELIYEINEKCGMPSLIATLDPDSLVPITREIYIKKINEIKADDTKLSNMTLKQLISRLELEQDPKVIIAIIAVLFDKIHCQAMTDKWGRSVRGYVAINGKDVINFVNSDSILWIAEPWLEMMEDEKYSIVQKKKWVNALKTRAKNILKEKKSIWSLKFFIEWLTEKHVEDNKGIYEDTIYDKSATEKKEPVPITDIQEEIIEIDESEIPF